MLLKIKDVHGERVGFRVQGSGERLLGTLPRSTKLRNRLAPLNSMSDGKVERRNSVTLEMHEQHGNVYENKGSAFHSPGQGGYVYEK